MVDNICCQGGETVNSRNKSSKILSGWYAQPFSPGSFEMCFHVQITFFCKSEKLAVFFWYRQGQKGTGRAEIYVFLTVWRNKGTQVHLERRIPVV